MSIRVSNRGHFEVKQHLRNGAQSDDPDYFTDIDTLNARGVHIFIAVTGQALSGTNSLKFTIQDSDDGTTYADVDQDHLDGTTIDDGELVLFNSGTATNLHQYNVAYTGSKRYIQIGTDETGTVSCNVCLTVLLTDPRETPVA